MSAIKFSREESIRVVPLHQTKEKFPLEQYVEQKKSKKILAGPKLTYRNGPLLATPEVFTIFWGNGWKTSPLASLVTDINDFFGSILISSLIDQLAEYNTAQYKVGHGKLVGSTTITTGAPARSITDTQVQIQLKTWIQKNKTFPKPGTNTLYFLYLDNGITVSMGGSKSCSSFCGYHNAIGTSTFYAVMPYPSCSGCLGGLTIKDALTGTSSHELCEAITDPIPGAGWYDDHNGEIGDICAWQFKNLNGYNVQLEWSNQHNKCI